MTKRSRGGTGSTRTRFRPRGDACEGPVHVISQLGEESIKVVVL